MCRSQLTATGTRPGEEGIVSISSVSGGSWWYWPSSGTSATAATTGPASATTSTDPVGDLLGMNRNELALQLQQQSSLAGLAAVRGISRADLLDAIQAGMPASQRDSVTAADDAGGIADTVGLQWPLTSATSTTSSSSSSSSLTTAVPSPYDLPYLIGPFAAPASGVTASAGVPGLDTAVGDLLGMNPDELTLQLHQHVSMYQVALSKGIGRDQLLPAIQADLTASGTAIQGSAAAASIADATDLTWPPTDTSLSAGLTLSAAAASAAAASAAAAGASPPGTVSPPGAVGDLFGMDTESLNLQLAEGSSLSGIAAAKAISWDDLISAIQSDLSTAGVTDGPSAAELAGTAGLVWPPSPTGG
jgi:hypothetical protein